MFTKGQTTESQSSGPKKRNPILTVNWDIDNRKLIPLRDLRLPKIEISFDRDFAYPDIWVYESEDDNPEPLYRVRRRARYFAVFYVRKFFTSFQDFSFLAFQMAGNRIVLYSLYDDVIYFLRKIQLLKESAGIFSFTNLLMSNLESTSEIHLIKKHSQAVSELASRIAFALGAKDPNIKMAGLIHDIGKICLPASLVYSSKIFDDTKTRVFQLHPLWGEAIYQTFFADETDSVFKDSIGFHHERLDGSGYIRGLTRNIPDIAKIIAVSDIYTMLTVDRQPSYSFDRDVAISYIVSNAGRLFDQDVVQAFRDVVV